MEKYKDMFSNLVAKIRGDVENAVKEATVRPKQQPYRRPFSKLPGKNTKCPCGSGKKYRKCCKGVRRYW